VNRNLLVRVILLFSPIALLSSPARNIIIVQGTSFIHSNRVDIPGDQTMEREFRSVGKKTVCVVTSSTRENEVTARNKYLHKDP